MALNKKTLKAIIDRPFFLGVDGTYRIKPIMSGYTLEKDGTFHGAVIPWHSTSEALHIAFSHCGKFIETKIKLSEMIFKQPFNIRQNEPIRTNSRA